MNFDEKTFYVFVSHQTVVLTMLLADHLKNYLAVGVARFHDAQRIISRGRAIYVGRFILYVVIHG